MHQRKNMVDEFERSVRFFSRTVSPKLIVKLMRHFCDKSLTESLDAYYWFVHSAAVRKEHFKDS